MAEAARISGLLRSGQQQRSEAYAAIHQLAQGADPGLDDVAAACASPLCEVLTKDAATVNAQEFQRAAQVLAMVASLAPGRVSGELMKPVCQLPSSALALEAGAELAADSGVLWQGQCNICSVWMSGNSALSGL